MTSATSRIWTVALIAGLVGAAAASGVGMWSGAFTKQTTVLRTVTAETPDVTLADAGDEVDWSSIDDSVAASVVSVTVHSSGSSVVASGLIMPIGGDGQAYVVTDRSALSAAEAADDLVGIEVTLQSGLTVRGHWWRQDTLSGLALIEVTIPGSQQSFPHIGSISDVRNADPVMVVDAPAVSSSLFVGAVSSEDQTAVLAQGTDMDNLLVVSTPPSSGVASGGPLVDQYGQVVGLTVSLDPIDGEDSGLTFAVPIDEVERVAQDLADGEAASHPWIGITNSVDVPSATARQMDISGGAAAGRITPGGPASRIGMTAGDIITSFDGHPIDSTGALLASVDGCQPGRVAPITYVKASGQSVNSEISITDEPNDA